MRTTTTTTKWRFAMCDNIDTDGLDSAAIIIRGWTRAQAAVDLVRGRVPSTCTDLEGWLSGSTQPEFTPDREMFRSIERENYNNVFGANDSAAAVMHRVAVNLPYFHNDLIRPTDGTMAACRILVAGACALATVCSVVAYPDDYGVPYGSVHDGRHAIGQFVAMDEDTAVYACEAFGGLDDSPVRVPVLVDDGVPGVLFAPPLSVVDAVLKSVYVHVGYGESDIAQVCADLDVYSGRRLRHAAWLLSGSLARTSEAIVESED